MQKKKGISLIVLVITIIVMIILAGSIIITLSNSGIITKANEAVDLNNEKQMEEYITSELILNGWYSGKPITEESLKKIDGVNVTAAEVGGAWIIEKDGAKTTIYETGDIVKGETKLWTGESSAPEIKDGNWYIYTPEQLKFLADVVNGGNVTEGYKIDETTIVYLMNDLDLGARQENGELKVGTAWTPIGISADIKFEGTFDGNNHTIRGVYVSKDKFAGIFGQSNTIKNLTVKDSYIKTTSAGGSGGIVAIFQEGTIENCHNINTQVVGATYNVGGIVGSFNGTTVKNCSNTGTVQGNFGKNNQGTTGGIVGYIYNQDVQIIDCTNYGSVSSNGKYVGGITGRILQRGSIINCVNRGNVSSIEERLGGIVGDTYPGVKVTNCINTGNVEGKKSYVGGVAGAILGILEKCYNTGSVKLSGDNTTCIGGIAGVILYDSSDALATSVIRNTYNTGKVIAEGENIKYVGGIVGVLSGGNVNVTINNNYNVGEIQTIGTGINQIGGVVGSCGHDEDRTGTFTVNNNYYLKGTIETDAGNSTAKTSAEMKTDAFVTLLNTGLAEAAWEIRAGQNSGYPVLIGLK